MIDVHVIELETFLKNILVIDTSDNILKIALHCGEQDYYVCEENTQRHVEILIPKIKELFESANADVKSLNEIYVCCGPGSFTGLRIGIATAITLAYSLSIPVYGFCAFSVYEYQILHRQVLVPLVDGKKHQFYCAFITDKFNPNDPDQLFDFAYADILDTISTAKPVKVTFAGKDVSLIEQNLQEDLKKAGIEYEWLFPNNYTPQQMLEYIRNLGHHSLKYPEPIYIRKSEAEIELMNRLKKN